jgi:hypothetical protein
MIIDNNMPKVPEWVPRGAQFTADLLLKKRPPAPIHDGIMRLLCDSRMKTVWRELTKRKREGHTSSPDPFHEAKLPPAVESWQSMADAESRRAAEYQELGEEEVAQLHEQRAAAMRAKRIAETSEQPSREEMEQRPLALIFILVIANYGHADTTIAQKDLDSRIYDLRSKGENDVADALERHAAMPENSRMIVQRHRTDSRINAFIELLALQMQEIFGAVLPSTIATITNVMFEGADFDRYAVRAVLKSRPGRPAA